MRFIQTRPRTILPVDRVRQIDPLSTLQQATLQWIRLSTQRHLPLAPFIRDQAIAHNWSRRRLLHRFADRLEQGMSLVDAIDQTPGVVSRDDAMAIRFSHQNGTLMPTLNRLVRCGDERIDPAKLQLARSLGYIRVLLVIGMVFWIRWAFRLMPEFAKLGEDLFVERRQEELTSVLRSVDAFALLGGLSAWDSTILLVLAVAVGLISLAMSDRGLNGILAMVDHCSNRLGSFFRGKSTFIAGRRDAVLDLLADAVNHGRPVVSAVSSLGRYHFDPKLRRRFLFARNEIEHDVPPWNALEQAGVMTATEHAAIVKLVDKEDAWLLRTLASQDRDRRIRTRIRAVTVFNAVAILIVGAMVGCIAWLTFSMLSELIHAQS